MPRAIEASGLAQAATAASKEPRVKVETVKVTGQNATISGKVDGRAASVTVAMSRVETLSHDVLAGQVRTWLLGADAKATAETRLKALEGKFLNK